MELKIYDTTMDLVGIIDTSTAVIWNRKYYTAGSFEIYAPANEIEIGLLQKQYIVTKDGSLEFGIIEDVTIEQKEDGEFIKATGRFGSSLLARRIIFATTILSDTYEVAMRSLVYNNAIDPTIGDRIIPNLILGSLNGFIATVNFQVSYRNLLTVLQGLSVTSGIACRIRFDPVAKKYVFETYAALDRSVDQSVNARAIFSNDYDNLLASLYQTSDVEYSNIALVGGEGEGIDRKMIIVGAGAGLDRYEIFVNAKDVRMEAGITEPDYLAMLAQKGAESLTPRVEYFEGNVLTEGTLNYKQDYDLGDIVTIENSRWGKRINVQITEITEVYDDNGMQVIPVFGTTSPSLGDVLSKSSDTSGSGSGGTETTVTPNKALVSDASGKVAASAVTDTELDYLSGVTSALQTQINAKQATITGGASTIVSANLTASRALASNVSGKVVVSTVTDVELGYLSGVTSALQTQINAKQATITGGASTIVSANLTASRALASNSNGKVVVSTVTDVELGYLSGVTSALQTQIDTKAPLASPTFTGVPAVPTAAAANDTTQIASTAFVHNAIALDAVDSQGSNANGYWIKFASGLMICYQTMTGSYGTPTSWGSGYTSAAIAWTFPVAFYEAPEISGNVLGGGSTFWVGSDTCSTTVGSFVLLRFATLANASRTIKVVAIGRWK